MFRCVGPLEGDSTADLSSLRPHGERKQAIGGNVDFGDEVGNSRSI